MGAARVAALVLGVSLLWSAVAKIADRSWPASAAAFGVPRAAAVTVVPAELALGAALAAGWLPVAAWVAIALLALYTGVLVRAVAAPGDAPPCACFGGWSRRPASWVTVVRNGALLALAGLAAAG